MKKIGYFLVPLVMILLMSVVMPRIFADGVNFSTLLPVLLVLVGVILLARPKKAATKSAQTIAQEVLDDFCADAFSENEELNTKFYAALKDIGNNCPKAAITKLEKLTPLCETKEQKYAAAMAGAQAYQKQNDLKGAIREYNKAIVLHPSAKLAYTIGESHQRLGYLDKARDSYEFAMELDPKNPQYPSSIGTTYVGDGDYDTALDYAADALALQEDFPQALATMAICHGVRNEPLLHKQYLKLAVENGYSESKIEDTIKTLKKRESR